MAVITQCGQYNQVIAKRKVHVYFLSQFTRNGYFNRKSK